MWQTYYNGFCAALASLLASVVCKTILDRPRQSGNRRVVRALLFGAIAGTLVLILGLAVPNRVAFIRHMVRPETTVEGIWMQRHANPDEIKYAVVQIHYDPAKCAFSVDGHTYLLTGQSDGSFKAALRADWKSKLMAVESEGGTYQAIYFYTANVMERPIAFVEGFGNVTFSLRSGNVCNAASGYYKDTQLKEPMHFNMRRLSRAAEDQFFADPATLIKNYNVSPDNYVEK